MPDPAGQAKNGLSISNRFGLKMSGIARIYRGQLHLGRLLNRTVLIGNRVSPAPLFQDAEAGKRIEQRLKVRWRTVNLPRKVPGPGFSGPKCIEDPKLHRRIQGRRPPVGGGNVEERVDSR